MSLSNGFEDAKLKITSRVVDVVRRPWLLTILICIRVLLTASRNHFVSPIVEGGDRADGYLETDESGHVLTQTGFVPPLFISQWTNQSHL